MPFRPLLAAAFALLTAVPARAAAVDPLTATIDARDADRFAQLFAGTDGAPTAAQVQTRYLDGAGEGVRIFTPDRIKDAAAMAAYVARHRADYQTAINRCLPVAKQANAELRAIYLGLRGIYPDRPLPPIFIVFGRGNSGGTAGPDGQVLGLEVLCKIAPEPAQFRQLLRIFFAHETVHTWQPENTSKERNVLLRAVLQEGAADYVASLVFGGPPSRAREVYAAPREAEIWRQFMLDVARTRGLDYDQLQADPQAKAAVLRWINNYGAAPPGWPYELGYWVGLRIWSRLVDRAADKRAAIDSVLSWTDPEAVLAAGALRAEPVPGARPMQGNSSARTR